MGVLDAGSEKWGFFAFLCLKIDVYIAAGAAG